MKEQPNTGKFVALRGSLKSVSIFNEISFEKKEIVEYFGERDLGLVLQRSGVWLQIITPSGQVGWSYLYNYEEISNL
jgi:hypothetical protein